MQEITAETVKKLLEVVDAGLTRGMGEPEPGKMCVEAAINYALGGPHNYWPKCVATAVGSWSIFLNDLDYTFLDEKDRAKALRRLAMASASKLVRTELERSMLPPNSGGSISGKISNIFNG